MAETPTVRTDLPEPTEAEVEHLAGLVDAARLDHGIYAGSASLARFLLAAGYRLVPEPEPVRYGKCRECEATVPLSQSGHTGEHQDSQGHQCTGSKLMPAHPAAEAVSTDGR